MYTAVASAAAVTNNRKLIRKKLIIGAAIAGVVALSSCRAHKKDQPTCYYLLSDDTYTEQTENINNA